MTNNIVTVNVSQTVAPTPSTLQKTGAIISQGGTTGAAGTQTLLTQASDLTALVAPSQAIQSMSWAGGTVTVIMVAPHGFGASGTLWLTIAGATPSGYNGTYLCTMTTTSRFTYALVSDPGANTVPGTMQITSAIELQQAVSTFFDQGSGQAVYINELGFGSPAAGVTALGTWITANPTTYYAYLVPRSWGGESSFPTFAAGFTALTKKTYFFTTMTNSNFTSFPATLKSVMGLIEAPAVSAAVSSVATEFSMAAPFFVALNYAPSSTNKVTPFQFSFLFGVTAYPPAGNGALFATWKAAGVNIVGTGSEGGISNTILFWGTTMDLRPFNYWYSVDWAQINIQLDIANAVINGSNNPINPLYEDQDGINRLQAVGAGTLSRGISYGLVFGKVEQTALDSAPFIQAFDNGAYAGKAVINAVPFPLYYAANPSNYRLGIYGGFSVVYTPQLGFNQIIFNVNVTDFVAQ